MAGSRKAKGNRYEVYAMRYLESLGWTVHRAQNSGSKRGNFWVSNNNDLWNCVDLACLKMGERPMFLQITSDTVSIGTKRKKMEKVPFDPQYCNVQIWFYTAGRNTEGSPGQFFQVRKLDEHYELRPENRIFLSSEFRKDLTKKGEVT